VTRSPLAYPLTRGFDADGGGAADLQTDIMRFMAILSLCLVAIFALVQSLPMAPEPSPTVTAPEEPPPVAKVSAGSPAKPPAPALATPPALAPQAAAAPKPVAAPRVNAPPAAESKRPDQQGFTLRFASDPALARLVARGDVAFYALGSGRSLKLAVRDSRMSFWDASTPGAFHEMEKSTVPAAVVDALARAGGDTETVRWGVTLPRRMKLRLDTLMREHPGGALVIAADGSLDLEPS